MKRIRVLIVDDHSANLRVLAAQCRAWGMEVAEDSDPLLALKRLERGERFDLALLDADMPFLDGRSLAEAIQGLRLPDTLSLILVGSASNRVPAPPSPAHFVAEICKPVRRYLLAIALFLGVTRQGL